MRMGVNDMSIGLGETGNEFQGAHHRSDNPHERRNEDHGLAQRSSSQEHPCREEKEDRVCP
jgi:hypothetical protein